MCKIKEEDYLVCITHLCNISCQQQRSAPQFFFFLDFLEFYRRENIIEEMLNTEMNYVDDLKMVLTGYRDKLEMSNLKLTVALKTDLIFGNLEEIWEFHADTLLPQLESCHLNPTLIAKTFLEYSQHLTRLYCR